MQRSLPRFKSKQHFMTRYLKKWLTQIYRDLYGDTMQLPICLGTKMKAGNQQGTSVTEFCYKSVNLPLEEPTNVKLILSNSKIPRNKSLFLSNVHDSSLGRHVNAASQKSFKNSSVL